MNQEIAVIGMSGIFPGARNLEEYWDNLLQGKDSITEIPQDRWNREDFYFNKSGELKPQPGTRGGFINGVYDFDPVFFQISPKEAPYLDPQHRKTIEMAFEAFTGAGYSEEMLSGSDTGVFLGMMGRGYFDSLLTERDAASLHGHAFTSSLLGFSANRISYHFNLKGPSITIDTLCSSSLVAIHQAVRSLMLGECRLALAGGAYLHFSPEHYALLSQMNVLSPDGRCKPFDDGANGIVSGEGVGIVLLKRLDQALADKDPIQAVIKGTAVNNDGKSSRFTATSPEAQESLITKALESSSVHPETVTCIETHGTGTALGDPIELAALQKAFGQYTDRKGYCSIGSVKSNIGHLEPAAGIAGLLKMILAMKHRILPPTLHVQRVNHFVDLANTPFYIQDAPLRWEPECGVRRGGVSSFGMGGTNAHIIVEEAPNRQLPFDTSGLSEGVLLLSAKSEAALARTVSDHAKWIAGLETNMFHNLCYTASRIKSEYPYRVAFVASSMEELKMNMEAFRTGEQPERKSKTKIEQPRVVFKFGDNPLALPDRQFFRYGGPFKPAWDTIEREYREITGVSLLEDQECSPIRLKQRSVCIQFFYMLLLNELGIRPEAIDGSGFGIFGAMAASGEIGLEEALRRVALPIQEGGAMTGLLKGAGVFPETEVVRLDGNPDGSVASFLQLLARMYVKGAPVRIHSMYKGLSVGMISLPAYPFDIKRYCYPGRKQVAQVPAAIGDVGRNHTGQWFSFQHLHEIDGKAVYEWEVTDALAELVAEHEVSGKPVLPGAAYPELIRSLIGSMGKGMLCEIRGLLLTLPLVITTGRIIRVTTEEKEGEIRFRVESREASERGAALSTHATGEAVFHAAALRKQAFHLDQDLSACSNEIDLAAFYRSFEGTGIRYGPRFRVLKRLCTGKAEAVSELKASEGSVFEGLEIPFPLLDGVLQTAIGLIYTRGEMVEGRPFVPFGWKEIRLLDRFEAKVTCAIKLRTTGPSIGDTFKVDVGVYGGNHQPILFIDSLTFKRASATQLHHASAGVSADSGEAVVMYRPVWLPLQLVSNGNGPGAQSGRWLCFADSKPIISREEIGTRLIWAVPGSRYYKPETDCYEIRPEEPDDYNRLLKEMTGSGERLEAILYFSSFSGQFDEAVGLQCFLHVLKAIVRIPAAEAPRLLVITGIPHGGEGEPGDTAPVDSGLLGMVRVFSLEYPTLSSQWINFDVHHPHLGEPEVFKAVANEINGGSEQREIAFFGGTRHVLRLDPAFGTSASGRIRLKPGGVYLITGGLGGIGTELALWLGKQYGARVALVTGGPLEAKRERIVRLHASLKGTGAEIACFTGDVSDANRMEEIFLEVSIRFGSINGIFHAAGRIGDGLLKAKTPEQFTDILLPKVKGTKVIGELAQRIPGSFLVLFSSISSVFGNVGQIDYAAANAYMDAYAHALTRKGTPCLSISWSYWQTGMGQNFIQSAINRGYRPMDKDEGLLVLEKALQLPYAHIVAFSRTSKIERPERTTLSAPSIASAQSRGVYRNEERSGIQRELLGMLARLLELDPSELDAETPFIQYGMDSLLSVSFAEEIADYWSIDIDATSIFDYPDISKLSEFVSVLLPDVEKNYTRPPFPGREDCFESDSHFLSSTRNAEDLKKTVLRALSVTLELGIEDLVPDMPFMEMGVDSLLAVQFTELLSLWLEIPLDNTLVFDYPNIEALCSYLLDIIGNKELPRILDEDKRPKESPRPLPSQGQGRLLFNEEPGWGTPEKVEEPAGDIAIIGLAGRFPGAESVARLWENIVQRRWSGSSFPQERVHGDVDIYASADYAEYRDRLLGSYLDGIDRFDPLFFDLSPREAELMDPQQRLLLETVWHAIEDAGVTRSMLSGSQTGVFIGACITEYTKYIGRLDPLIGTGNELSILSNRISYLLDLKGPSMTLDTACSSSLVALDTACQNIQTGRCGMAIVGGINLILTPYFSMAFDKAGMLSSDGRCKTFDDSADGYARGEGAGVVLLKPLTQALRDKDTVYAVIKGTAVNQDGYSNGLTAPNALAQEEVILEAWQRSRIDPRSISLVEAHGTGTRLGDPIEIKGLTRAFRNYTGDIAFCAIGSVKSNIGHLEPAAGISGIIKVVEALRRKILPPTGQFNRKNGLIPFEHSPFYINDRAAEWCSEGYPRRAVVSSFGFGGTNAHVVLEEAPETSMKVEDYPKLFHPVTVSAKSKEALQAKLLQLEQYLTDHGDIHYEDVCYSLAVSRDHQTYRAAFAAGSFSDMKRGLARLNAGSLGSEAGKRNKNAGMTLLFGSMDGRFLEVAAGLHSRYKVFAASLDEYDRYVSLVSGRSIKFFLSEPSMLASHARIENLNFAKVYALAVALAAAELLRSWGIEPETAAGSGVGHIAAACFMGRMSSEEALLCALHGTTPDNAGKMYTPEEWGEKLAEETARGRRLIAIEIGDMEWKENGSAKVTSVPFMIPGYQGHYSAANALASLYLAGADINWQGYYRDLAEYNRVPLPLYPFQHKRYWADGGNDAGKPSGQEQAARGKEEPCLFRKVWQPSPISSRKISQCVWLVMTDGSETGTRVAAGLESQGCTVIKAVIGSTYEWINTCECQLLPSREEDYQRLAEDIESKFGGFEGIVQLWPGSQGEQRQDDLSLGLIGDTLTYGLVSTFSAARAFLPRNPLRKALKYVAVTLNAKPFGSGAPISPAAAAESAFVQTLAHEWKGVRAKSIDFDQSEPAGDRVVRAILSELAFWDDCTEIVYRRGERYVPRLASLPSNQPEGETAWLKPGEAVMITGGATGIGYLTARRLAEKTKAKIALTGRMKLPPEPEWQRFLSEEPHGEQALRIRNILELRSLGAEAQYYQANVSSPSEMEDVLSEIQDRWGSLKGIIHCAGVIDSVRVSIKAKSRDSVRNILEPKVFGTLCLYRLIRKYKIPAALFYSSLSSAAGACGAGMADYAAANAFMDAVACRLSVEETGLYKSVQWPVWEGAGMSTKGLSTTNGFALAPSKALQLLERVMTDRTSSVVIVIDGDYQSLEVLVAGGLPQTPEKSASLLDNPYNSREFGLNRSDGSNEGSSYANLEAEMSLLNRLLMLHLKLDESELDPERNFDEYGLDSLTIADVMGGIEEHYGQPIEPSAFLAFPCVRELAEHLAQSFDNRSGGKESLTTLDKTSRSNSDVTEFPPDSAQESLGAREDVPQPGSLVELLRRVYCGQIEIEEAMERLEISLETGLSELS
ncbi:SDR family NAD(P)-dependent oxidoreductase [Paenibacillus sp. TH7-28]